MVRVHTRPTLLEEVHHDNGEGQSRSPRCQDEAERIQSCGEIPQEVFRAGTMDHATRTKDGGSGVCPLDESPGSSALSNKGGVNDRLLSCMRRGGSGYKP